MSANRGATTREERTLARYRELVRRYQQLLRRVTAQVGRETAAVHLGWFALRRSTSAFAMVREGKVVLANPRWHALARPPRDAARWFVREGTQERSYADVASLVEGELGTLVRRRGESVTLECQRRPDGLTLRLRIERLAGDGDGVSGLVLAADVSDETAQRRELERLRERMIERERMTALGRLGAGVAHDLGNTVNALALQLQAARRKATAEQQPHFDEMQRAVDTMRGTLDRLDRFAGGRALPNQPIDLAATIRGAGDFVRYELAKTERPRPVRLALELPPRLPRVVGQPADVTQMFVNLFLNARDAMPEGGTITVRAWRRGETVVVCVEDEGTGFAPADLPRVFEPFFTTKGARGSGLGLSIAYATMTAVGGSISAANRDAGGAALTLCFVVARRKPRAKRAA